MLGSNVLRERRARRARILQVSSKAGEEAGGGREDGQARLGKGARCDAFVIEIPSMPSEKNGKSFHKPGLSRLQSVLSSSLSPTSVSACPGFQVPTRSRTYTELVPPCVSG